MHMPDMSGLELSAALHRTANARSPIILLTSMGLRPFGASAEFAAILAKPVKGAALREALCRALSPDRDDVGQSHARRNPVAPVLQPLRILLAEDNLVNQRVAQLMLDKMGHTVDIVADGRAAVDAVTTVAYDVVLMDVQMPQMDGLEAARRIRARLPAEQQPYIIAMTANALVEDRHACAAAGMEAYLAKPVRAQELKKLLARVNVTITRPLDPGPPAGPESSAPPLPPPAVQPVDDVVISDLRNDLDDDDGSALDELIGGYLTESSDTVHELAVAVAADDMSTIMRLAHTWKSTAAILGATTLAALLAQAEGAALRAPDDLTALTAEIEQEHDRVTAHLRRLQHRGSEDHDARQSE